MDSLTLGDKYPKLRDDFKIFLALAWKFLGLPPPTPVQYEIADWMQHGPRRQGTEAFRGVGKSWIASAYVLWRLRFLPQYKFLIVSASKQRAEDFSTFTQRLILEMPLLQSMEPNNDQRWSKVAFDVVEATPAHAPSVKSIGVFGMMTGSRADEIIADDVEIPNNSATEELREKLRKAVGEFESILKPGGKIKFLGTPQTEESIYNKLADQFKYTFRIWPAQIPPQAKIISFGDKLAPSIEERAKSGKESLVPTDPLRFNELDLEERRLSMGNSQYHLQFLLDTSLSDAERYPLKTSDLIVTDLDLERGPAFLKYGSSPELEHKDLSRLGLDGDKWYRPMHLPQEDIPYIPYEGAVMYIDPSGRGKDLTVACVVKQLHGFLYCTALEGYTGGYTDMTLIKISKLARDNQVKRILVEPNFGDGMFVNILKPVLRKYHDVVIEDDDWSNAQKETRIIEILEPVLNRHRLVFNKKIVVDDIKIVQTDQQHSLFYQMTRLTKDKGALKHDDKIDCLAGAVRYWVKSLARNEHQALQQHRDRVVDKDLKEFIARAKRHHPNNEYFKKRKPQFKLNGRGKRRISTSIRMMKQYG